MILGAQINKAIRHCPLLLLWQPSEWISKSFHPIPHPPSCKHIWDAMVGLVSAFGGKFGFFNFLFQKRNIH